MTGELQECKSFYMHKQYMELEKIYKTWGRSREDKLFLKVRTQPLK